MILLAALAAACEPTTIAEFTDKPVVCCYLKAGETPTLTVQKLIPFQSDAQFSQESVEGLAITITDATTGQSYLMNSIGEGVYTNGSLIAQTGHNYTLNFQYNGEDISAQTVVPTAPEGVEFSGYSIGVMSFTLPDDSKAPGNNGIEITWNNPNGEYFIVEGVTESISLIRELEEGQQMPAQSFKLDYTQGESANLSSQNFNYYGIYTISVIHINQEYAVMSQGGSTSSATLVDVRGNIDGGYGIFSGINSVTDTIRVRTSSWSRSCQQSSSADIP